MWLIRQNLSLIGKKTSKETENILLTSIFSSSHNIFQNLQGVENSGFCGNGLTHYQTTNFRLFQTERVCRRQFQIWQKWQKVIQTGRKHCGKRRNCSLQAISPFPTVFSKGLFPRGLQKASLCGNGLKERKGGDCIRSDRLITSLSDYQSTIYFIALRTGHNLRLHSIHMDHCVIGLKVDKKAFWVFGLSQYLLK